MEWKEYIDLVISSQTALDGISLHFDNLEMVLSPVVKASILMLEDMIVSQGKRNIFVFPDMKQFSQEFLLAKVIYNITAGKIKMSYDPYTFTKGQKLKYKDCIVVFESCGIDERDGIERIFISFADTNSKRGLPFKIAPIFQMVDSKRVSTEQTFNNTYSAKRALEEVEAMIPRDGLLETLSSYKTHLDGSIFYVSEIKSAKGFLTSATLDGTKISDVMFLAHANGDGDISNLSSGQMTGNPAIIIASDLYSVINAVIRGVKVQSIIFDASQPNAIEKQLDAFDDLAQYDFPIVCITDTANSFDNGPLVDRGYNEWRWDKDSLTESLYPEDDSNQANIRVKNCARHKIKYLSIDGLESSEAIHLMYKHKTEIEEQLSVLISTYEKLFSLVFTALRNTIPIEDADAAHFADILEDCSAKLEKEKKYISKELYDDIALVIVNLQIVLDRGYKNKKHLAITELLKNHNYGSACIVISDKQDKLAYKKYWTNWCDKNNCRTQITVMYPQECQGKTGICFDATIIVGWLSNRIMRNVIYHFDSDEYIVLTYQYEEQWKRSHTRVWCKKLDSSNNGTIVKKSFSHSKREISSAAFERHDDVPESTENTTDELADIEQLILTNKYRRYSFSGGVASEVSDAYPVSFVGGLLAFYRSGHKVITVTDIIQQTGSQIHSKLPEALAVGDFVVIREAQRDIIRDLADGILSKEGRAGLRDISHKWKESIEVELLFSTSDEIYQKLKGVGCKKDFMTVKNWLTNDELIIPQDQEDLLNIAAATNDEVLLEKAELIYAAGREVRAAHTKAGRLLSERLKNKIAEELQKMDELDSFNIWDPITLQLEDVGNVKILKVIDIGQMIPIETNNTNRLLSE